MKLFIKSISNIVFVVQVILFFLLCFQQKIVLPLWLQSAGRLHPMLLHLPIGLMVLAALLWIFRKNFDAVSFQTLFLFLLHVLALTASLTSLMGFFLSKEGGYNEDILALHKWTGVGVSFLSCVLLILYKYWPQQSKLFIFSLIISLLAVIVAGHYGATLTHGEGYVLEPLKGDEEEKEIKITDSTDLFTAAIRPILTSKCFSCHNNQKAKGQLIMTSIEQLLKGGKNGPVWIAGDAINSHIIQYINLSEDDKKHMPPSGKPQLNEAEKALLYAWIQAGAERKKSLKSYNPQDSLFILATAIINQFKVSEEPQISYGFKAASAKTIAAINTPFCLVSPLYTNAPALSAEFFVREKFDPKNLENLLSVKEQLVRLNLSNMPVKDADVKLIAGFPNLEILNLNNTDISNKAVEELAKLRKLVSISLAGTKVDKQIIPILSKFASLKNVFVWNSGIAESDLINQKQVQRFSFDFGYQPDSSEVLKLNPPIVNNENFILSDNDSIALSHSLPGTTIRYTIDGTQPDSLLSTEYKNPVFIKSYTALKAIGVKPGWYASDVVSYSFFRKGVRPDSAQLNNPADNQYKGGGAPILIDSKKGSIDNMKDSAWLGFREKPFSAYVFLNSSSPPIRTVTISYAKIIGAYIMPPLSLEIWAGADKNHLKLMKKYYPNQPLKMEAAMIEGIIITLPAGAYPCYKIVANPVSKLPPWHPGKGDRGWFFIDEIFFNQ